MKIDGVSYTLGRQLGQGGTAQVFEARSSEDDKVYALKRIRKDARSSRNERFRNEIAFGIAAKNDHVVKIHAKFENEDYFYYIMDLYSKNLRGVMMEESDYEVLLDYLSQLCDGLAYIHREGIVHRDIKPENILIDVDNRRLVLADFGIAHFKDSFLTKPGEVLANRNYQAPEQMSKGEAVSVGQPADIFALGLIFTEVFTKQNPRGARHRRVGDVHPFLSNIDLLVERMTYQDETQRLKIQAVRESLNLLRQQISYTMDEIVEDLRHADVPTGGFNFQTDQILKQAGTDVLSAKYIFERATAEELALYNPHYHCEISYRVSPELYNICVHSKLYSMCKAKFEYEAKGTETELDLNLIVSPRKADLLSQFQSVQRQYPLSQHTIWAGLPPLAAHYFRFSKDYHCEELLESIHRVLSTSPYSHNETLHRNLVNAPIIWIASSVRNYLNTGFLDMSPHHLQEIEFETHLRIHWEGSTPDNSSRKTLGAELFDESADAELITRALGKFQNKWNASFLKQSDGRYSIYFRLRDEYVQFSKEALSFAAPNYEFEGDVLDLLRIDEEYDDVIALTWDSYDICSTLAKVLGLREI